MKNIFRTSIVASFCLFSCTAPLSQAGSRVIETDDQTMVQCDFVGLIKDHSILGGFGEVNAKNDYRSQAASRGANHIVYQTAGPGSIIGAKAYRCLEPVRDEGARAQPNLPLVKDAPPKDYDGYRRY